MTGSSGPDQSLIVCTRNRCERIPPLLASISRAASHAPDILFEAIVVDNGSTDGTMLVLEQWAAACDFPVLLVTEPRPGLARARNVGLAQASGRLIAMTDDDCQLHADYLRALRDAFASRPGPAVIGGRITLGDPLDLAVTFKLEEHAAQAPARAFPNGFVMGANLAFTRDVPARVGGFDPRFGTGARFLAAEDTEFVLRALQAGIDVHYDPVFTVDHHHGRRGNEQLRDLLAKYAFGDGAVCAKHLFRDRRISASILRDLLELTDPIEPFPQVPNYRLFRLGHMMLGAAAYAKEGLGLCPKPRRGVDPPDPHPIHSRRSTLSTTKLERPPATKSRLSAASS